MRADRLRAMGEGAFERELHAGGHIFGGGRFHDLHAVWNLLALGGVNQPSILQQNQTMIAGLFENLRGPGHPPGIISPQNGKQVAHSLADILEPPEHIDGNADAVAPLKDHFSVLGILAPAEGPLTTVDDKDLCGFMAVLGIDASRRLAGATDIEAMRLADVDMLIRAF